VRLVPKSIHIFLYVGLERDNSFFTGVIDNILLLWREFVVGDRRGVVDDVVRHCIASE
jgi:hypothetical protein